MTHGTPHQGPAADPLTWAQELNHALQANDDATVWDLVASHRDPEEAESRLATQVSRLCYPVRERARYAEIFLTPIIEMAPQSVLGNDALWRSASFCISEALDIWLSRRVTKLVFEGARPYDWVGTWRPAILRSHLNRAVPGGPQHKVRFQAEDIQCPPEAPRLGFICTVITSDTGWPQLPSASQQRDNRFKQVVSFALQDTPSTAPPVVLTPDRVQFAVADGLCLWLLLLSEVVPIRGWAATMVPRSPDVLKVTLQLDHDAVPFTQFTLRRHQLGPQGVRGVLEMLQSLAPSMELPMDMSSPAIKREVVLT